MWRGFPGAVPGRSSRIKPRAPTFPSPVLCAPACVYQKVNLSPCAPLTANLPCGVTLAFLSCLLLTCPGYPHPPLSNQVPPEHGVYVGFCTTSLTAPSETIAACTELLQGAVMSPTCDGLDAPVAAAFRPGAPDAAHLLLSCRGAVEFTLGDPHFRVVPTITRSERLPARLPCPTEPACPALCPPSAPTAAGSLVPSFQIVL